MIHGDRDDSYKKTKYAVPSILYAINQPNKTRKEYNPRNILILQEGKNLHFINFTIKIDLNDDISRMSDYQCER